VSSRRALLAAGAGGALGALLPVRAPAATAPGGDVYLRGSRRALLHAVLARLGRIQRTVGHGNFYLLGFDRMLRVARDYSAVGPFPRVELAFLEELFAIDARVYGFYGEKVLSALSAELAYRELVRVPGSAQRLVHGAAQARLAGMRRLVGDRLVLTSGVRGMVKQIHLFLRKAARSGGNLSRAARSLAPPGYSFHAIGDFDIGERGLGAANFTAAFTDTEVFRRLSRAGALPMRYPRGNRLGVRFEPWHVRVV